jgi:hypothetical protein
MGYGAEGTQHLLLTRCRVQRLLASSVCPRTVRISSGAPLDSITAKELRKASNYMELPRWPGVSGLKPETSASYQAVAERVAKRRKIARIHLDVYWWGGDRCAV